MLIKKLFSIVLSLAVCISMLPMAGAVAFADEQNSTQQSYVYYTVDGTTAVKHEDGVCTECREIKWDTRGLDADCWYAVTGNVTVDAVLYVHGSSNIILCDGAVLTATKGINVSKDTTLNIYAQSAGTGKLISTGAHYYQAGIGGNEENRGGGQVVIHGGDIKATGNSFAAGIGGGRYSDCGHVVIYDGTIEASGGNYCAGIGSGADADGSAGIIDIYGGTITSTAPNDFGAGIGGSRDNSGSTVNIYGGNVTAKAGTFGAGIGGGDEGSGGNVTINGGTVNASAFNGAGIGGGYKKNGGNVTINGGTVIASGFRGIGAGQRNDDNGTLTLAEGIKFGAGENAENIDAMGDASDTSSAFSKKYFVTPYIHEHVFNREIANDKYLKKAGDGTCIDSSVYYKSCFCGEASKTETFSRTGSHHEFSETWEKEEGNFRYHKRTCKLCKKAVDFEPHDFNGDTCTVCGFELKCDISLDKSRFTYSGKSNRPEVLAVEFLGEEIPTEVYDVVYPENTVNAGKYEAKIVLKEIGEELGSASYEVVKATPQLKVTTVTKKYKKSTIRKYSRTAKQIWVSGARGKLTYKKVSGSKKLKVNYTTGKITCVKHHCVKKIRSHSIKVKVTCAGNSNYNKASKIVTVTVKMLN